MGLYGYLNRGYRSSAANATTQAQHNKYIILIITGHLPDIGCDMEETEDLIYYSNYL